MEIFFLFFPIVVGVGLLLVKKWGWWVFIGYSVLLIGYNSFLFATAHNAWNMGSLVRAILGTAIVIYFARKDISAPYFKMYPRGWRLQKRIPILTEVQVDEKRLKTKDISVRGLYVDWDNCKLELSSEVIMNLQLNDRSLSIKGGIVRIDPAGIGIAFREITPEIEEFISDSIY